MASFLPRIHLILAILTVSCYGKATHYKDGEKIEMYVNKVGPYFNPHETYHYYSLPVCRPEKVEHRSLTLGEVLEGDRMALSLYNINFKMDIESNELCKVELTINEIDTLTESIEDLYYFEFVLDELPIRGFIGHLEEGGFLPHTHNIYIWTHLHFEFTYNGDQVVTANVSTRSQPPTQLGHTDEGPLEITFTYSVSWKPTKTSYDDRGKFSQQNKFFPKTLEIHWLSIINSMVLVFLLIGFVVIILMRILRNDFAKYNSGEEYIDDYDSDDNGWKIIHTDVFRFPAFKSLLCSMLGIGSQFLCLASSIIVMALLGMFNVHKHGSINSAAVLLYALTSCVAGYVSSNMYRKLNGEKWVWNIILTSCMFSVPFFMIWSVVNSVAWYYGSTQALPASTVALLFFMWLFVGFPLTVLGGIFGKNWAGPLDVPCRTKNIPREIPVCPWYHALAPQMIFGGFLPFSAISVELYYIFATLWGREQYTLWGVLTIVFFILLSVSAAIGITLTYFQLSNEDYRWWWRSFLNTGSAGVFVFLYALFYFYKRSHMYGVLQTVEYFGYTFLMCYIFFLVLGTVSFFSSLKFIRYIYVNLKMD